MRIEERLARLEQQNKWMRRGGSLAIALAALVLLVAQGDRRDLTRFETRRLTISDANGTPRIDLMALDNVNKDSASLVFYGPDGKERRLILSVSDVDTRMRLTGSGDDPKRPQASVHVTQNPAQTSASLMLSSGPTRADVITLRHDDTLGSAYLALREVVAAQDRAGLESRTRVDLGVKRGHPALSLNDPGSKDAEGGPVRRAILDIGSQGNARLVLRGREVIPIEVRGRKFNRPVDRISLAVEPSGHPLMWLGDGAGNERLSLGLGTSDNSPGIRLYEKSGSLLGMFALPGAKPVLTMYDVKGNVIWHEPR